MHGEGPRFVVRNLVVRDRMRCGLAEDLPPPVPSNVQILGEGAAAAPAVVDVLEELGVLAQRGGTP